MGDVDFSGISSSRNFTLVIPNQITTNDDNLLVSEANKGNRERPSKVHSWLPNSGVLSGVAVFEILLTQHQDH